MLLKNQKEVIDRAREENEDIARLLMQHEDWSSYLMGCVSGNIERGLDYEKMVKLAEVYDRDEDGKLGSWEWSKLYLELNHLFFSSGHFGDVLDYATELKSRYRYSNNTILWKCIDKFNV